jgi:hypothetical protein
MRRFVQWFFRNRQTGVIRCQIRLVPVLPANDMLCFRDCVQRWSAYLDLDEVFRGVNPAGHGMFSVRVVSSLEYIENKIVPAE